MNTLITKHSAICNRVSHAIKSAQDRRNKALEAVKMRPSTARSVILQTGIKSALKADPCFQKWKRIHQYYEMELRQIHAMHTPKIACLDDAIHQEWLSA